MTLKLNFLLSLFALTQSYGSFPKSNFFGAHQPTLSSITEVPVPVDSIVPSRMCPDETERAGKGCIKKTMLMPTKKCKSHAMMTGGVCVSQKQSTNEVSCPPGFHMVGKKKCIMVEEQPAVHRCEPGYTMTDNGNCIQERIIDVTLQCDHGFQLSPDGFCFRETKTKAAMSCPLGSTPSTKGCVSIEAVQPDVRCDIGMELDQLTGNCVRRYINSARARCDQGYCLNIDPVDGTEECVGTVSVPGEQICPNGGLLRNGECEVSVVEAVTATCKLGYELQNNTCVKISEMQPKYSCRKGLVLEHGQCVGTLFETPDVICPDGLVGKKGLCEELVLSPVIFDCPLGFTLSNTGDCIKEKVKPANLICPLGAKLDAVQGQCLLQRLSKGQDECLDGSIRTDKSYCLNFETVAPRVVCADKKTLMSNDGSVCISSEIVPQSIQCPFGFSLNKLKDVCTRTVTQKLSLSCPKSSLQSFGTHPGFSNVSKGSLTDCITTIQEPHELDCPDDFVLSEDGDCIRFHDIPLASVCPEMYVLAQSGQCVPSDAHDSM